MNNPNSAPTQHKSLNYDEQDKRQQGVAGGKKANRVCWQKKKKIKNKITTVKFAFYE